MSGLSDRLLLKWHVQKNGDTMDKLAESLGLFPKTLYLKYKDDSPRQFTQTEILKIALRYKLTPQDITNIFFKEVNKIDRGESSETTR